MAHSVKRLRTLPNGMTVECTDIQFRRVHELWESCKDKSAHNMCVEPNGQYIAVRRDDGRVFQILPNAEVFLQNGGLLDQCPFPPPLLPSEVRDNSKEVQEKLIQDMTYEWRTRFKHIWNTSLRH